MVDISPKISKKGIHNRKNQENESHFQQKVIDIFSKRWIPFSAKGESHFQQKVNPIFNKRWLTFFH